MPVLLKERHHTANEAAVVRAEAAVPGVGWDFNEISNAEAYDIALHNVNISKL